MAKLDAVVEGEMDEGFQIREEDVNRVAKGPTATTDLADSKTNVKASKPAAPKRKSKGPTPDSAKSKTNAKASKPATSKKRKSTPK